MTVIDVSKPRVDCEKSCRRWTIGNFAWNGRAIIEEQSDEFEGHVMHLTQSQELLIQTSCGKSWRGAECKSVQPRILAVRTGSHGRKHRTFQEEEGFDFWESAVRRLVSAEPRRFSPDSVTVRPPDVICRSGVSLKSQQKARNMCKSLGNHVCRVILKHLRKEKLVFSWCTMAGLDAESCLCDESPGCGKAWRDEKPNFCKQERSDVARVRCDCLEHTRSELESVVECLSAEEDDVEDIEMPGDELRDGSEGEEQEPMEDGGRDLW